MKYCLKCGYIVSDNSTSKDKIACSECGTLYTEDDMTGAMFESLSEEKKQAYADSLFKKIMGKINDTADSVETMIKIVGWATTVYNMVLPLLP